MRSLCDEWPHQKRWLLQRSSWQPMNMRITVCSTSTAGSVRGESPMPVCCKSSVVNHDGTAAIWDDDRIVPL